MQPGSDPTLTPSMNGGLAPSMGSSDLFGEATSLPYGQRPPTPEPVPVRLSVRVDGDVLLLRLFNAESPADEIHAELTPDHALLLAERLVTASISLPTLANRGAVKQFLLRLVTALTHWLRYFHSGR
ncbi:hypothetical protein [Magnetospira sp. QH-2]|uniref:hypothetical protein n=1 Tax=Magnetospira sp. (strain QH-2) TaxID=1288970 RepID=UPI0003E816E5|nr:hypothetical protein [Magnetospira sp. QH-2]CCQ74900.1 protein of unknown function [Magnetospira sp. QH-2]